ncbi:MAG: ABC transporter permease [Phocaeicola sp.]|nr:ABC transporter permease [Phocaeicola sp.]MDD7449414.1 ABC transporter permease [Prevotellaceae bacterium]MDY3914818.1 ABC transporter permease [Phocaeicola sp.]MDY5938469.1 ABC transporter permease [Phocaeicola sp.]
MNSNISLLQLCRAEIYKVSHNRLIVTVLFSLFGVCFLSLLYAIYKSSIGLFNYEMPHYEGNPWMMIWSRYTLPIFSLMFPLAVVILSYLICEIEFQNNNIRSLFSLPVVRWKLYLSKILVLFLLILMLCIFTWLGFILCGYLYGVLIPAYRFIDYPVWISSAQIMSRALLASCCVGTIGLVLSLLSRNFTLPILACILLTSISLFIANKPLGNYVPFATYAHLATLLPVEELVSYGTRDFTNVALCSVITILGYSCFDPQKRIGY